MGAFNSNSSYYLLFREQFEQELLDAIACPGASVELLSVQAGSVLASTVARYPLGPLPGGSLSPAELEQAVASIPESLFSADFIDEYGPLGPAIVAQIQGNEEDVQADPADNTGTGIGMPILVIGIVGAVFATVLAGAALFLLLRQLRERNDQGPSYAQVSSFPDQSRAGGVQQGLMEITSKELQKALEGAQVLGKGGQAVVYGAHLPKVHREAVAIKKLEGAASSPVFAEEARRLHQLGSNPNIINIYAICPTEGALVMELGQDKQPSLHHCLARPPFLPWRKRPGFLYDVASALWHVHSQGMLHLDIKPGNIIIKQDGKSALLADFGMADEVRESGAASLRTDGSGHEHVGTTIYKDPFVVNVFRPASDVYSLGVTIIEAVTGQMAHKMPELLSTEAVRGWSKSESQRRDSKAGLLSLLDQRDGVAGPSESDKEEWRRCASHLLDLAFNCMDTAYAVRPTVEELTERLLIYSKPPPLLSPCWVGDSSKPAPSAAPLSSGRRDAIKEQIRWHWRLVEKIIEHIYSNGVPLNQVRGKVATFGGAIKCAIKDGLITKEDAERYTRRNKRGNAAKHMRGRWADIEKGLVQDSGAAVSSSLPDIPLEGIEKVERQVRHHMDLVRQCQDAGHQDVPVPRKKSKGKFKTRFENFWFTIQYAAEKNVINDQRKTELEAINDEGNQWKHDELPGFDTHVPSGLQEDHIALQVIVEEPSGNVALGPPPPYKQRQLERADMLEE